jgi:hypothetical protein
MLSSGASMKDLMGRPPARVAGLQEAEEAEERGNLLPWDS